MKIEIMDSQIIAKWRTLSCGSVFALLFYSAIASILVIVFTISLPVLYKSIAWGIWILWFGYSINRLSGKNKLIFDRKGAERTYTSICYTRKKYIDLAEIRYFKREAYSLLVRCQAKDFGFDCPVSVFHWEECDSLINKLNVWLGKYKSGTTEISGTEETEKVSDSWWKVPDPVVFEPDSPPQYLESPPNGQWCYQKDRSAGFVFQIKEEGNLWHVIEALSMAVIAGFLLIGSVNGFLMEVNLNHDDEVNLEVNPADKVPVGKKSPVSWIVVSVFCFIGAAYLLGKAKEGLWTWGKKTTLKFTHGSAEFRRSQFGITTWARNAVLTDWHSLAVCLPQDIKPDSKEIATGNPTEVENLFEGCDWWKVEFHNTTGESIPLIIERLTKPEALWMADVILREQKSIR